MLSENELNIQFARDYDIITTPKRYVTPAVVSEKNNYDLYDKLLVRDGMFSTGAHRTGTISASEHYNIWLEGVETVRRTLEKPTQLGVQDN
jgi:hypothetical protein